MHDPTKAGMEPPAPIVSVTRPSIYRQIFAQVPYDLQQALASDLIYITNSSLAFPSYSFERRRAFQRLLHRYFRQILHGCQNPQCSAAGCRSYLKRISKRPFRGFTATSAWALATFFATQDNAEAALCPNEPVKLQEGPGKYLKSRAINMTHVPLTVCADSKESRATTHPNARTISENNQSEDAPLDESSAHGITSRRSTLARKKDLKSFSQNLFDTVSMKMLHLIKVPEGYAEWEPWADRPKRAAGVQISDETMTTDHGSENDGPCSTDSSQSELSSLEQTMQEVGPVSSTVAPPLEVIDMKSFSPGLRPSLYEYVAAMMNLPDSTEIALGYPRTSGSLRNYWETDAGFAQHVFTRTFREPRSLFWEPSPKTLNSNVDSDYLVDDIFPTVPLATDLGFVTPPQSLSRLTVNNIRAMVSFFTLNYPKTVDEHRFSQYLGRIPPRLRLDSLVTGTATRREREIAFACQSIISVLGSVESLLRSFKPPPGAQPGGPEHKYGFILIVGAFHSLAEIDFHPGHVLSSLWRSTGKLYPPKVPRSRNAKANGNFRSECYVSNTGCMKTCVGEDALDDDEARHVAKVALAALMACVPRHDKRAWSSFCASHGQGGATYDSSACWEPLDEQHLALIEVFDDDMAIDLMTRLVKAMVARKYTTEVGSAERSHSISGEKLPEERENIIDRLLYDVLHLRPMDGLTSQHVEARERMAYYYVIILLHWLRSVILKNWDGKAEIARWGAVGCALEFSAHLFRISGSLGVHPSEFQTPFIYRQFDIMEIPTDWPACATDRNTVHILSYPFLFRQKTLVSYFRAVNHAAMSKAYQSSLAASKLENIMTFTDTITGRGAIRLHKRFREPTNKFLVLEVRRESILRDTLNQLWRRGKRELMKPLKVHIGGQEGEEGIDHGGVQQEFMRIAICEFLMEDYGLFTTDAQSHMSWFQPLSLEPLYKFELFGLMTSLALYNGLTLPVNFPLALYRKLLNLPVTKLEHIKDGWPSLAQGLRHLLDWTDGNVEDVFVRSYSFSVEAYGKTIAVDMDRIQSDGDWPSVQGNKYEPRNTNPQTVAASDSSSLKSESRSSSDSSSCGSASEGSRASREFNASQPCMVTNENRESYVDDFIFWLTDRSVRLQYEAFVRGFRVCVDPKAISIFTPETLKSLVEGIQEIDLQGLRRAASYEGGYYPGHRVIREFWGVVRGFSTDKVRQLLEFVTASDRIPIQGISSVDFIVQRNGDGDERLPTSMTCFGRLLLPEYSSQSILEEKLCTAIENCKGFGVA